MTIQSVTEYRLSRRDILKFGGMAALSIAILGTSALPADANPKQTKARLKELTNGVKAQKGRINIMLPKLTQDGKRTRLKVSIDSPMTDDDFVKSVHVLAERNTVPDVASYHFSPLCGKCEFVTRIRVAKSQTILVAAEMSDGSVYLAKARCNVARGAGGCG